VLTAILVAPTLEQDCAVCKDQFKLGTDDPDEQVVITLPCKHPFHEPCIMPWLQSSGTCPVCRHALVPQPEQHGSPPRSGSGSGSGGPGSPGRPTANPGPSNTTGLTGGLFQALFGNLASHNHSNNSNDNGGRSTNGDPSRSTQVAESSRPHTTSDPSNRSNRDPRPGPWSEDLD
jgi:E3 ubiquitin-protein ligase RNF115/126